MAKKSLFDDTEKLLRRLMASANRAPEELRDGERPLDITEALKLIGTATTFLAVKAKINPDAEEVGVDDIIAEFHGNRAAERGRGGRPKRPRDEQPLPAGAASLPFIAGPQSAARPNGADPDAAAAPAEAAEG